MNYETVFRTEDGAQRKSASSTPTKQSQQKQGKANPKETHGIKPLV